LTELSDMPVQAFRAGITEDGYFIKSVIDDRIMLDLKVQPYLTSPGLYSQAGDTQRDMSVFKNTAPVFPVLIAAGMEVSRAIGLRQPVGKDQPSAPGSEMMLEPGTDHLRPPICLNMRIADMNNIYSLDLSIFQLFQFVKKGR